jgi:hypothetical protein
MKRLIHYTQYLGITLLSLFPLLVCSCSDEEEFTLDRGAILSFSTDTIAFDTLFVEVTSATERFCIYNHNSKGLRIQSARLESGGTSGFMMNVDGQSGSVIQDVQIYKKDSAFVFVKVNIPTQSSVKPEKVTDAIIFTLESGVEQKVQLLAYGQNANVWKAKVLNNTEEVTQANDLPYLIYDSLVVAENTTWRIKEGNRFYFHNGASLIVHGTLIVEGTQEEPVVFRGDRMDRMFSYLPYDRLDNQWGGIYLSPSCQGLTLNHADIHSGNYGVECDGIQGEVNIQNTMIHNVAGYGLYLKDTKALVANTQVSNSRYDCVSIYGGTSDFYHCTFAQFYPWKADRGHALYVSNYIDETEHIVEAAHFYNCFITGYDNDEVYGYPGEKPLQIQFDHCVLLTDVSDETYFHDCIGESKDSVTYKSSNFREFDTHAFRYDFRLDSLSIARGKGASSYAEIYPVDLNGIERKGTPDAGCYQFEKE